jgi:hypothetical protein
MRKYIKTHRGRAISSGNKERKGQASGRHRAHQGSVKGLDSGGSGRRPDLS